MKHLIVYLIIFISILIVLTSCSTKIKYVKVPLSTPPEIFIIKSAANRQDLMRRYQESIIKIGEWQLWYNIQTGTNYYKYKDKK